MKPESAAFLPKAQEFLTKASGMLDDWPDEAGRAAYSPVCTARKR
jgi:hypothetical protein